MGSGGHGAAGESYSSGLKEKPMTSESSTITEERLDNIHPGEILLEEFLKPMQLSAYRLAKETGIPATRISQIIHSDAPSNPLLQASSFS